MSEKGPRASHGRRFANEHFQRSMTQLKSEKKKKKKTVLSEKKKYKSTVWDFR
jgi:hypothetical protein